MNKFAKQFRVPRGFLGKIAGKIMYFENRKINEWTLQNLDISDGQTILEVGYGPGYAIGEIAKCHPEAYLEGIDISGEMLKETSSKYENLIKEGRLTLLCGEVSDLPSKTGFYNRIFSVNNYPLWHDPTNSMLSLAARLKKGGKIAITVQPREKEATDETAREIGKQLVNNLNEAGLQHIKVHYKKVWPVLAVCVTARKPL
ncbi:class I SAM-dependent methyltransferase [Bacillus sp. B-jedd]|uniref:class I SAM-dependent methyltransferase n=1 Tax=Bacillus sp. B-jedd TaxID=1476857 RepID=UPI0005156B68|nr:class I SAM-dependent methyltransferase [Bacillus sp. B-jedd]CEG27496.1 putative methyltransferase [Bacillus sp. B-jedd]